MAELGALYLMGTGVPQNCDHALELLLLIIRRIKTPCDRRVFLFWNNTLRRTQGVYFLE